MDVSLTGGLPMTLIGIGTVFAALAALVFLVMLMTRIAVWREAAKSTPSDSGVAKAAPRTAPQPGSAPTELLRVALAAYSFHRQRHARVNSPTPTSPWSSAGRLRQIAPFRE